MLRDHWIPNSTPAGDPPAMHARSLRGGAHCRTAQGITMLSKVWGYVIDHANTCCRGCAPASFHPAVYSAVSRVLRCYSPKITTTRINYLKLRRQVLISNGGLGVLIDPVAAVLLEVIGCWFPLRRLKLICSSPGVKSTCTLISRVDLDSADGVRAHNFWMYCIGR